MSGRRRAQAGQYAHRVNRTLALLHRFPVPAVLQVLVERYQVSLRQARRYVEVAQRHPQGVPVPQPTVVFTVKLPVGLVRRVRTRARSTGSSLSALVARALGEWLERVRPGPRSG
jgi:hypothetical protein